MFLIKKLQTKFTCEKKKFTGTKLKKFTGTELKIQIH